MPHVDSSPALEASTSIAGTPFQLSSADIDRIKAEEALRMQLRNTMEKKELQSPIIAFLNSPFGLFLLSTLLISGLGTYLSQQYQERKEQSAQHQEAIKHLTEFDYRLAQIDYRLLMIDMRPADAFPQSKYLTDIIEGRGEYQPSIKEYEGLNMIGLMSWFNYNLEKTATRTSAYHNLRSFLLLREPKGIYDTKQVRTTLAPVKQYRNELDGLLARTQAPASWLEAIGTAWGIASLCGGMLALGALIVLIRKRVKPHPSFVTAS